MSLTVAAVTQDQREKHTCGIPNSGRRDPTTGGNTASGGLIRVLDRNRACIARIRVEFVVSGYRVVFAGTIDNFGVSISILG